MIEGVKYHIMCAVYTCVQCVRTCCVGCFCHLLVLPSHVRRSKYITEQHKEWVRTAVGHFFAIICHKTANIAGPPPPPPERQFSHADSLESPLLTPSDSLGSHDNTDREDVTTYREELLFSESMLN